MTDPYNIQVGDWVNWRYWPGDPNSPFIRQKHFVFDRGHSEDPIEYEDSHYEKGPWEVIQAFTYEGMPIVGIMMTRLQKYGGNAERRTFDASLLMRVDPPTEKK